MSKLADKVKGKVKAKTAKVKTKAKKAKTKVKSKVKACVTGLAVVALMLCTGCLDTNPASRSTEGTVTVTVNIEGGRTNTTRVSVNDVAQASADSSGSTETQTATPTLSLPISIDARYNDAIAGASKASKDVLSVLKSSSLEKVLELMSSKKSGKVEVERTDGTKATVNCEDGQCSFIEGIPDSELPGYVE